MWMDACQVNQNSSANDATIHDVMSFNGLIRERFIPTGA